jgi:Domain of unknown function (DUF4112)
MAQPRAPLFEAIKAAGPSREDSVARLEALAHLLDSAFQIPGTNHRVGIDALLGLIPGIGDLVSTALASYIIWEAKQLGLPRWKIARMIGNVAVDTTVGAIPFAGDLFDVAFRANRRNMKILRDHLERTGAVPKTIDGQAVRLDR